MDGSRERRSVQAGHPCPLRSIACEMSLTHMMAIGPNQLR
jgi:hypothetical protein